MSCVFFQQCEWVCEAKMRMSHADCVWVGRLSSCFDIRYWILDEKNYSSSHSHHFFQPLTLPTFHPTHLDSSYSLASSHIARVEVCQKNFKQPSPTTPYPWVDPTKFFFHHYSIFSSAKFLPNTPTHFIFTSHIARVEVCPKNFKQLSPTTPYPWVYSPKKFDFFIIIQPLTSANFLPNTPTHFIFTSHIAWVDVCRRNFKQPSPTTPYPWPRQTSTLAMWLVNMKCVGVLGEKLARVKSWIIVKKVKFFRVGLPMGSGWFGRVVWNFSDRPRPWLCGWWIWTV